MLAKLSAQLTRFANGWFILALLIAVVLISQLVIDPFSTKLAALSGGSGLIDLMLTYSPETAFHLIDTYGTEGRAAYSHFTATADFAFPVVYGLLLSLALSWLLVRGTVTTSRLRLLNLLPVAAWLFDWLENAMILMLLSQHPTQSPLIGGISGVATSAKWLMSALTLLALSTAMVLWWKTSRQGNA
jgi:hypothetical protein